MLLKSNLIYLQQMLGRFDCCVYIYIKCDIKDLYCPLNLFSDKGPIYLICCYYFAFEKINRLLPVCFFPISRKCDSFSLNNNIKIAA